MRGQSESDDTTAANSPLPLLTEWCFFLTSLSSLAQFASSVFTAALLAVAAVNLASTFCTCPANLLRCAAVQRDHPCWLFMAKGFFRCGVGLRAATLAPGSLWWAREQVDSSGFSSPKPTRRVLLPVGNAVAQLGMQSTKT
jgi:hypothetical protein